MSLTLALASAQSGLQANSLRAHTVASNIANASTPGYVRRTVLLGENIAGTSTQGVRIVGIQRSENMALTTERWSLSSDVSRSNILSSTWQTLSSRLGDSTSSNGLFSAYARFENNLTSAIQTPESPTSLTAVIDSANAITHQFHSLYTVAVNLRREADAEIAAGVQTVNDALEQVEQLNIQMSSLSNSTEQLAALQDERNRAISTIAEYLPIDIIPRRGNMVDIVTREGVFLLAGTAREIEFTPTNNISGTSSFQNGDVSGLSVGGQNITPGTATYASVSSGLFGGLFNLRDQEAPGFLSDLDALASDMVARFSEDSLDPTKAPGSQGLFTSSIAAGIPGIAATISVNSAIDPDVGGETWRLRDGVGATTEGSPGNTSILEGMLDALSRAETIGVASISSSMSAVQAVAEFSSIIGQKRVRYEAIVSSTTAQYTMISNLEFSQTGVDTDQELQELLIIEQAYAANARVIDVAQRMLEELMGI